MLLIGCPHLQAFLLVLFGIEGIRRVQEVLSDDVVSKMIVGLDRRGALGVFNKNKIRDVFQGFQYEIINKIGEERGVRLSRER